jgi:hypothetical protein
MLTSAGGPNATSRAPRFDARPKRIGNRARAVPCALAALLIAVSARGENGVIDESKPADAKPADARPEIGFSADELEGDLRVGELVLRGNVVITYDRFRLTSPELRLARTPRGIAVRGWGEVVFCPCPEPPVSVGFRGGLVAPPADLLLDRPELRIGGTTMAVLPWFWLRAPSRAGLLPPTIAWRGSDGLLLGLGAHVPWGEANEGGERNELDVNAAAYARGGFDLSARARTEHSTNRVRWDHLRGDLVAVDAHGSEPLLETGAVAWDIDAARGSRARNAAPSLDEAARAYDRAAGEATFRLADVVVGGLGFRAEGARGGSGPSERTASGPRATLAASDAIGAIGAWDALSTMAVLEDPWLGATELGRIEGGVEFAARPSFLVTRLGVRESATAAYASAAASMDALAVAQAEIAAPFVRAFGGDDAPSADGASFDAPFIHVIEPRARASAMTARTSGAYWSATGRPLALASGTVVAASIGARTTWGRWLSRSAGALEIDVGEFNTMDIGNSSEQATAIRYRTSWSTPYFGWSGEGAARLVSPRGQVFIGRARVGEQDGWHLAVKTAGRTGIEPIVARALAPSSASEPSGGWLSTDGWSGAAELRAKFGRAVSASVAADEDITSKTLLAWRTSVTYAHPCRCVSVDAFAGRRLARGGVDVWVSIDLAPR